MQWPVIQKQEHKWQGYQHGFSHQAQCKKHKDREISAHTRFFRVITVSTEGKHPEESGKHILAFSYPGNRLHMERMYRKQGGYKGTRPEGFCHPAQYQKQKDGIHHMKEKIDQMIPGWIEPEN